MSEPKTGMYSDSFDAPKKVEMLSEAPIPDSIDHAKVTMVPEKDGAYEAEIVYDSAEKPKKQLLTEPAPNPLDENYQEPKLESTIPIFFEEVKEEGGEVKEEGGEVKEEVSGDTVSNESESPSVEETQEEAPKDQSEDKAGKNKKEKNKK